MLPMPPVSCSLLTGSRRRFAAGLVGPSALAAVLAVLPATPAHAETGGPSPQGYTGGVTAAPPSQQAQQAAAAPPVQDVPAPAAAPAPTPDAAGPIPEAQAQEGDDYADADPSALTDFSEPLAPYGQWVQDPTYGTIWVPDSAQVGADFAPYQTAGQWGVTDTGDWIWQSDYAWGYIPFHYGRWVWAGSYWGWIPGRRYAPAWVTWRVGEGGYVGWAPLPPTWYWAGRRAARLFTRPLAAYCFVPTNYAFNRGVSAYVVRDRGMVQSIAASTHAYHPATPTVGGRSGMSPTLSQAHVPASASPRTYTAHNARATAFATRASTAAVRHAYTMPSASGSAYQGSWSQPWHPGYTYRSSAQTLHAPQTPVYSHWGSSYSYSRPSMPSYTPSVHGYTPSTHAYAPAYRPAAPSYHAPSSSGSHSSGGSHFSGGGHFGGGHGGRR